MSKRPPGNTTAPASKERGNGEFTEQFTSAVLPAHLQLATVPRVRDEKGTLAAESDIPCQTARTKRSPASTREQPQQQLDRWTNL